MDNTVLVSYNASPSGRSPPLASLGIKKAFPDFQTVRSSPTVFKASTSSNHPIGQTLQREIEDVLLAVWKAKAAAKYKSFIDRWKLFCIQGVTIAINHLFCVLKFLYYLYENGCYFSRLSSVCSVLSTVVYTEGYS